MNHLKHGFWISCLALTLLLSGILTGQTVPQIFSSEEIALPGTPIPLDNLTNKDGESILLLTHKEGKGEANYTLIKVNGDASKVMNQPLNLSYKGKDMAFREAFMLGDNLLIISSFYNKKSDEAYLFSRLYDPVSLQPINELKPISKLAELNGKAEGLFLIRVSPDKQRFLVQSNYNPGKRENGTVRLQFFDHNAEEINERTPPLPASASEELLVGQALLMNDGQVIIPISEPGKRTARNKNPGYKNILYLIPAEGGAPKKLEYDVSGYRHSADRIKILEDNTLLVAGHYRNPKKGKVTLGYYCKFFDMSTFTEKAEKLIPFEAKGRGYGLLPAQAKNDDPAGLKEYTNFSGVSKILQATDGSVYLIGSQNYTTEQKAGNTYYTVYHTRNILAVHLTPAREVDWLRLVPMHIANVGANRMSNGFSAEEKEGHLYLLFNDNLKNKGAYDGAPRMARAFASMTNRLVEIKPNGSLEDFMVNGEKMSRFSMFYASRSLVDHEAKRFVTLYTKGKRRNVLLVTQL